MHSNVAARAPPRPSSIDSCPVCECAAATAMRKPSDDESSAASPIRKGAWYPGVLGTGLGMGWGRKKY
eukprot:1078752-Rhodomonas_salina.1